MFTGIVQATGEVTAITPRAGDMELVIAAPDLNLDSVSIGDSIAVNGCCLTVTRLKGAIFAADVSRETMNVTTLGSWKVGTKVNLEKALRAGDPLGGHYVTGHVDGVAVVTGMSSDGRSTRMDFEVQAPLARYIAKKGSVCVDGVSLTVNEVSRSGFSVNLIPHTLEVTILKDYAIGTRVNLEVDIIARYVERLASKEA
ncbi:MAG TPA: riboflavin synthase [Steroidobacteraceae bacterium]